MSARKEQNFLTKEGYEKLVQELHEFKEEKYPAVLERLGEAKAMGDLSENFEYKAALEDKDLITSRIAEIEELIDNVEIIKEEKKKGIIVDYGSKVTVDIGDEKEYSFTVVGTGEVSIDDGMKVSLDSPIGVAIRGKKVGDVVKMRLPGGRQEVKITKIQ